jgi:outer membrane protein OmpA-like peptidoglycan-associated protein
MHVRSSASDFAGLRLASAQRLVRGCVVAAVVLLTISGCSGGAKSGSDGSTETKAPGGAPPKSNLRPMATEPMEHEDGRAHVDLLAVNRTAKNTVTTRLRIVNDGQETMSILGSLHDIAPKSGSSEFANGIALLDGGDDKVYYPLTTAGGCLCSDLTNVELEAGKSQDVYAVFAAPPAATTRITVSVPLTVPFADIPIGAGQVPPAPDQTLDPAKVSLGPPDVRSLVNVSESADQGINDDDSNRTVHLSADVLFATNKADLTPRANALLRGVAKQIDTSKGNTVKIDGYTDNTGNDAINQPLSERRAQAVENALKGMMTRPGVTYQALGHGSRNPVAKNDEESGRRRNRRVTIVFAKPPAPAAPPPAPSSEGPFRWKPGEKLPVIASARPHFGAGAASTTQEANNLRFDVNSLHRDPSGLVTLVWTATNISDEDQQVGGAFDRWLALDYTGETTTSGASLMDPTNKLRYWPSRDGQGVCTCSVTDLSSHAIQTLESHGSVTYADIYDTQQSTSNVVVQVSWYSDTITIGNVAIK